MRKRHEALVQHGEPADAGVEDGDGRELSIGSRHGRPMVAGGAERRRPSAMPEWPVRASLIRAMAEELVELDRGQRLRHARRAKKMLKP